MSSQAFATVPAAAEPSRARRAFCLTGLCLLQLHAGQRPATWPLVGLGLAVPLLLGLLLIH